MLIMGLIVLDSRKNILFTFHPYTVSTAERSPLLIVHVYMYTAGLHTPMQYWRPSGHALGKGFIWVLLQGHVKVI